MSKKAIWSLNAKRSELGHATKGQIYLSKIGIGFAVWFAAWLVSMGNASSVLIACAAVFVTSKVCYYVNTGDYPDGWDTVADWCCDGALHFAWLAAWWCSTGNFTGAAIIGGLWLCTYPWSSE